MYEVSYGYRLQTYHGAGSACFLHGVVCAWVRIALSMTTTTSTYSRSDTRGHHRVLWNRWRTMRGCCCYCGACCCCRCCHVNCGVCSIVAATTAARTTTTTSSTTVVVIVIAADTIVRRSWRCCSAGWRRLRYCNAYRGCVVVIWCRCRSVVCVVGCTTECRALSVTVTTTIVLVVMVVAADVGWHDCCRWRRVVFFAVWRTFVIVAVAYRARNECIMGKFVRAAEEKRFPSKLAFNKLYSQVDVPSISSKYEPWTSHILS